MIPSPIWGSPHSAAFPLKRCHETVSPVTFHMRMCWGRVLWHLDTQAIRPSGLCLDLKFQSEVVQNSYKWASAGEMKAFSYLSLPKQPCTSRQFLKASEHWIDNKAKSTQHLIFSRRRSVLHRHGTPYRCVVSSGSLTQLTVAWLRCREETDIPLWCSTLQSSISPESAPDTSSSSTLQTAHRHYRYRNLPGCKVLQTFFCK